MFSSRVIVEIVGVVHTMDARNRRTAVCVKSYELCGPSRHYEDSMISFIQRHRVVRLPGLQRPIGDLVSRAVDHYNFRFGREIGVDDRFLR
jgi:hypothetical protein